MYHARGVAILVAVTGADVVTSGIGTSVMFAMTRYSQGEAEVKTGPQETASMTDREGLPLPGGIVQDRHCLETHETQEMDSLLPGLPSQNFPCVAGVDIAVVDEVISTSASAAGASISKSRKRIERGVDRASENGRGL